MQRPGVGKQITFLRVGDLEVSAAFYEEGLGLELVLDQGGCRIYEAGKNAYLGICRLNDPGPVGQESGVIYTLVVEDVDGWHRYLVEHGLEPEAEPQLNQEYGIYHFFLRDPDGYLLEFQRFQDPDWYQREERINYRREGWRGGRRPSRIR